MTSESVTIRDLIVAVFRHYRSRLWQRLIKADPSALSLAEEIDFAVFLRRAKEPSEVEECFSSGGLDLDESEFRTVTLH